MSVAMDFHPGKTLPKPISWKFGPAIPEVKCVSLALQGGSAHGAFTWGVLDRLLEEPRACCCAAAVPSGIAAAASKEIKAL
jgi:NTE family protein